MGERSGAAGIDGMALGGGLRAHPVSLGRGDKRSNDSPEIGNHIAGIHVRSRPAIVIRDLRAREFIEASLGYQCRDGACIGVERDGVIVGAAAFHDWCPERGTIEMTCAGAGGWLTRGMLRALSSYGFAVARMVVARVAESNRVARSVWRRIGGREYVIPGLWGDEAGVILTLTREGFKHG